MCIYIYIYIHILIHITYTYTHIHLYICIYVYIQGPFEEEDAIALLEKVPSLTALDFNG